MNLRKDGKGGASPVLNANASNSPPPAPPMTQETPSKRGIKFWKKKKKQNKKVISVNGKENAAAVDGVSSPPSFSSSSSPPSPSPSLSQQLNVQESGVETTVEVLRKNTIYNNSPQLSINHKTLSQPPPPPPPPPPMSSPLPNMSPAPRPQQHMAACASAQSAQSSYPSNFTSTNHQRNKMCMAKLHQLARKHGSGVTGLYDEKTTSAAASTSTPTKSRSQLQQQQQQQYPQNASTPSPNQKIMNAVLGQSPQCEVEKKQKNALKDYTSKPTSPTSIMNMNMNMNLSSLKDNISDMAQSSMKKFLQCTSNLKDVECDNIIQDGLSEFKDDFYDTYNDMRGRTGKGGDRGVMRGRRRERDYEYYDDDYDDNDSETEGGDTYTQDGTATYTQDGTATYTQGESILSADDNSTTITRDTSQLDGTNTVTTRDTSTLNDSTTYSTAQSRGRRSILNDINYDHSPTNLRKGHLDNDHELLMNTSNLQQKQINRLGVTLSNNNATGGMNIPTQQSSQINNLGVTINNNDTNVTGDIPMRVVNRQKLDDSNLANPITKNIPWDEQSASSRSTTDLRVIEEPEFVSLRDVGNAMNHNHYDYGLHNPLSYNNDISSSLRNDEGEI